MLRMIVTVLLSLLTLSTCFAADADVEKRAGKLLCENSFFPQAAGKGKVAFIHMDEKLLGKTLELFLEDIKTGELIRVLPGYGFRDQISPTFAFSPDGSEFVIPEQTDGNWEVFRYKLGERSGEKLTDLVKHRVEVDRNQRDQLGISPAMQFSISELSYSPSGKRLIFTLLRVGKTAVWWHDLATGKSRQATEERKGYLPCFHPDEDKFCYTLSRTMEGSSQNEDIVLRSLSTGEITTLCGSAKHERGGVISADGKYLLYSISENNIYNVHVKNLESGQSKQLTFAGKGQSCLYARWSADGKHVYLHGTGFYSQPAVFMQNFESF